MKEAEPAGNGNVLSNISFWAYAYFYMLAASLAGCGLTYLWHGIRPAISAAAFCVILAGIVALWKIKLSRNSLYLLDVLNLLGAAAAGNLVVFLTRGSHDILIGLLSGVAVVDVFSFTKAGRNTPNAKLSGNSETLARLSICLPIPGRAGLQPLIGVGDLTYFSLMMAFSLTVKGAPGGYAAAALITAGQLINILLISIFKKSSRYKGFPATFFPGIFYIAALVL